MSRQFCTFRLGELFMGIQVDRIQEILRFQGATPVPLAPPAICGLINLRGQIVTAIDLRKRAGLEAPDESVSPMNIILSTEGEAMSFVVDSVGDVIEVNDEDFEEPPDTLRGDQRRLILGAYKLERSLLLVLDTEFALDVGDPENRSKYLGTAR